MAIGPGTIQTIITQSDKVLATLKSGKTIIISETSLQIGDPKDLGRLSLIGKDDAGNTIKESVTEFVHIMANGKDGKQKFDFNLKL